MKSKQNIDYGYDIQKVYLEVMLSDTETFTRCQTIFDPLIFDKKLQTSAKYISDYVEKYNALPTREMILSSTHVDFNVPENLNTNHYDWLLDEFETFTRHKSLERAILKSADLIENGDYGSVEDIVKKAVQIGLQKDMGINYFADPKTRLTSLKDKNGQIATGWPTLDRKLYGGFNRGELEIFAGGSGCVTEDTLVEVIELPIILL